MQEVISVCVSKCTDRGGLSFSTLIFIVCVVQMYMYNICYVCVYIQYILHLIYISKPAIIQYGFSSFSGVRRCAMCTPLHAILPSIIPHRCVSGVGKSKCVRENTCGWVALRCLVGEMSKCPLIFDG